MFRRPAVWIDAVEDVSSVVVDCAQCANDPETLVASRLDTRHALVECSLDQQPTRLRHIIIQNVGLISNVSEEVATEIAVFVNLMHCRLTPTL